MATGILNDGTTVSVDGPLDPSLPVVVLLHGLGGDSTDMTAPLVNYSALAFNKAARFPLYRDEGIRVSPPLLPAARFYVDPPAAALTSWRDALLAAGFTTVTYSQRGPLIGNDAMQLGRLITEVFINASVSGLPAALRSARVAFVGHSRGGLVARSFLGAASTDAAFAAFLPRVTSLLTLHSPNAGSGLAAAAVSVSALLGRIATAFAGAGLASGAGFAAGLGAMVSNPSRAELAPGSPTLVGIAAREPVPGIAYHTFGGTSTDFVRIWADVYTPDSTIPFPIPFLPFPIFHWGSTPVVVGVPMNAATFVPAVLAAPVPFVTEISTTALLLAAVTPEVAPGQGDMLVSDARARLPFAASHTTNALNHLEALFDPTLQSQVIAILRRQRTPTVSGIARVSLTPFPVRRNQTAQYTVNAVDAISGARLSGGVRIVDGTQQLLNLPGGVGAPFAFRFTSRSVVQCTFDPETRERVCERELVWPTVFADLGPPYGTVEVDTGLP